MDVPVEKIVAGPEISKENTQNQESLELKIKELEALKVEIQKNKDAITSQNFTIKTLNQSVESYRESLFLSENQVKSLETEKLMLESQIRVLKKENENFEEEKARLRDVLFLANQGKDHLLNELELKEKLIQNLQNEKTVKKKELTIETKAPSNSNQESQNNSEIPIPKETPKRRTSKEPKKIMELNLIKEYNEEMLYNEVLELSQKAIDILKKYELVVNGFHKAKKIVKSNLKEIMYPEIEEFFYDFLNIIQQYTGKKLFLNQWVGNIVFVFKTKGPQEAEINETLMNCKTFLLDFVTQDRFETFLKRVFTARKRKIIKKPEKILEVSQDIEGILVETIQEAEELEEKKIDFKVVLNKITEKIKQNEEKNSELFPLYEKISSRLNELSNQMDITPDDFKDLLELIEKQNSKQGLGIWLFIKRLQNLLTQKSNEQCLLFHLDKIDSEIE